MQTPYEKQQNRKERAPQYALVDTDNRVKELLYSKPTFGTRPKGVTLVDIRGLTATPFPGEELELDEDGAVVRCKSSRQCSRAVLTPATRGNRGLWWIHIGPTKFIRDIGLHDDAVSVNTEAPPGTPWIAGLIGRAGVLQQGVTE